MEYIAFQYAEALFQLAAEKEKVQEILDEYRELLDALDDDFYMFMEHPNIMKKEKHALIDKLVQTTLIKHICFVLVDNHRIKLLPDVLEAYQELLNREQEVMDVDVFSKKSLTEEEKTKLSDALQKRFSKTVRLHNIVDKDIIGGVRLEYNGTVLDDTVNHYFKSLQTRLTK